MVQLGTLGVWHLVISVQELAEKVRAYDIFVRRAGASLSEVEAGELTKVGSFKQGSCGVGLEGWS